MTKSRNCKALFYIVLIVLKFYNVCRGEKANFILFITVLEGKKDVIGGYIIVKSEIMPRKKH